MTATVAEAFRLWTWSLGLVLQIIVSAMMDLAPGDYCAYISDILSAKVFDLHLGEYTKKKTKKQQVIITDVLAYIILLPQKQQHNQLVIIYIIMLLIMVYLILLICIIYHIIIKPHKTKHILRKIKKKEKNKMVKK
eukprot:494618_1